MDGAREKATVLRAVGSRTRPCALASVPVALSATNTWQDSNFSDRDGDGHGDAWYAAWRRHTTRLGRRYSNRGVPAHLNTYDLPFLRWTARRHRRADFLSDADLASIGSGEKLAHLYDFLVFPGHHEYLAEAEYDVVTRFRDLGGVDELLARTPSCGTGSVAVSASAFRESTAPASRRSPIRCRGSWVSSTSPRSRSATVRAPLLCRPATAPRSGQTAAASRCRAPRRVAPVGLESAALALPCI